MNKVIKWLKFIVDVVPLIISILGLVPKPKEKPEDVPRETEKEE